MKISAFSKYLAYDAGGAEKSTLSLLRERHSYFNDQITLIASRNSRFLGRELPQILFHDDYQVELIDFKSHFSRFSNLDYCRNRGIIARYFSMMNADELWSYGMYAPAAIIHFSGPTRLFIRSESDLGINNNYHVGIKRFMRNIYNLIDYPFSSIYRKDLAAAIERAHVVANSKYMASRTLELFGKQAEVMYPPVDISLYREQLDADQIEGEWVVFVGDSPVKGLGIVMAAARQLPNISFRIFSRFILQPKQQGNILWSPWERDAWRVYRGARLVIVPSQWEEAYGRVAREAYLLGIPVLVSNVGGLPEAVDADPSRLVSDYRNPTVWKEAIEAAVTLPVRD
jgi:glycosyltransferase involved in cell wall biosynthesis